MFLDRNSLRKLGLGLGAATEVVVYTMSGFAAGYFLDKQFQRTQPWLTVLFTLVGMIGGFYRLYQVFSKFDKSNGEKNRD